MTDTMSPGRPGKARMSLRGDIFGGFAAMLVAVPSAIAYGLIIFSPLGDEYAAQGALAGVIGSVAMGLLAPVFGGTARLVSAPCAPAAALLSAFIIDAVSRGVISPVTVPLYIAVISFGAGLVQIAASLARGGTFIKYIPYPVVAGYLSGVGVLIFLGQLPKFLGLAKEMPLAHGILSAGAWRWESIIIGGVTIAGMLLGPKIVKAVPASIVGLGTGLAAYFIIAVFNRDMMTIDNNHFVIGRIQASSGDIVKTMGDNLASLPSMDPMSLVMLIVPVISLGVLLSIDTLKTCLVLDVLTGSRHDSNRELLGQGVGNLAASLTGGVPGSGTMGGTLVNVFSGGNTRLSGIIEGISALALLLFFAHYIAWIPVASLAGVLLVVGVRMIDMKSFKLLKHRSTVFDFVVILAVIISAVGMSLITAAGVGITLSIILFLRNQIRFPVVRRLGFGSEIFSKKSRPVIEQAILMEKGNETLVVDLQGQLFFGTTDQLYTKIEPYIGKCRYFVLNMHRVLSIDFTAANMLSQLRAKINDNSGILVFTSVPLSVPTGQNVMVYLEDMGFQKTGGEVIFFSELDDALEWVEDEYLKELLPGKIKARGLDLAEIGFFSGIPEKAIATLSMHISARTLIKGEKIFNKGDTGDEIYFIRKGAVRIELPLAGGAVHHLATVGKGAFFGDMAFLDNEPRSADCLALGDVELFILSRKEFDVITAKYPEIAGMFFERLSLEISHRLRLNLIELKAIEES